MLPAVLKNKTFPYTKSIYLESILKNQFMKTCFKILAVLFVSTLSLSSCSSDSDSGDTDGTTTGNYFPLAVNNRWDYTNGSTATQATIIGTTNFGGTTYYEMEDTSSTIDAQLWTTKKGASYYQKSGASTQTQGSIVVVTEPIELKILRDDLAVGGTWHGTAKPKVTYTGSSSGSFRANITYTGTVIAKDATETLGSVTYNNIIKVVLEAAVNSNGQMNYINTEYWFAKDIGLIKEVEFSTVDNITKTRYLTSYELH
jgi:hypothetical protein